MKEKLEQIKQLALKAIEEAADIDRLNEVRVAYIGKKGELSKLFKGM